MGRSTTTRAVAKQTHRPSPDMDLPTSSQITRLAIVVNFNMYGLDDGFEEIS